jgi:V8-like Glu-specific endopeptidase
LALLLAAQVSHARADPLVISETAQAAWNAVGRVNRGGLSTMRICSGVLMAPDIVLTAAHCVPPGATNTPSKLAQISFIAGWNRGVFAAARRAVAVYRHPGYTPGPVTFNHIAGDMAVIRLESPINEPGILPFGLAPPPRANQVIGYIGYSRRVNAAPTLYARCNQTTPFPRVLFMDCPASSGNSGAPVFVDGPTGPQLVAVMAATGEGGSYAVIPDHWLDQFLQTAD